MRLASGGQINRNHVVNFTFDGQPYQAHPGDTLGSALFANDVKLTRRSAKYRRARGIFEFPTTFSEDLSENPFAMEIFNSFSLEYSTGWPNLRWDLGELKSIVPQDKWQKIVKELNRIAPKPIKKYIGQNQNADHFDAQNIQIENSEKLWAHCDLLIIGAGPTGLFAADIAARTGSKVILIDEDFRFGGRLNSETQRVGGQSGADWAQDMVAKLSALENVTLVRRCRGVGLTPDGDHLAMELLPQSSKGSAKTVLWHITSTATIIATGAKERGIVFPNNDRPGIILASALRSFVNRFGVVPGERIAVFCNNDAAWRTARDLQDAGVSIVALIDSRADAKPGLDCQTFTGAHIVNTKGRHALTQISVADHLGAQTDIEIDCLAVSGGWDPEFSLARSREQADWSSELAAFLPTQANTETTSIAGAANGAFTLAACFADARKASHAALKQLKKKVPRVLTPPSDDEAIAISPLWRVPGNEHRSYVDLTRDITVTDLLTANHPAASVNAIGVMAQRYDQKINKYRRAFPEFPAAVTALDKAQIERVLPSHRISSEHGAYFETKDIWCQPKWFPISADGFWRDTVARESAMARDSVVISDLSALGKFDISGPDATKFIAHICQLPSLNIALSRLSHCTITVPNSPIIDAVVARVLPDRFRMTLAVEDTWVAWKMLQRELEQNGRFDVRILNVTDAVAQFAVTGPQTEHVLDALGQSLPAPNHIVDGTYGEVDLQLFGFTYFADTGCEISMPSVYGECLFETLLASARQFGGGPIGTETRDILRLEAGKRASHDIGSDVSEDRKIWGLRALGPVKQIKAGSIVFRNLDDIDAGKSIGVVTSSKFSPNYERFVALARIQTDQAEPGTKIWLVDDKEKFKTTCEIIDPSAVERGEDNV